MGQDKLQLTLIQSKLYRHLPASIQVYNSLALALSEDGIERKVVTKISDLPDRCSVVMFNLAESPKVVISMFCTDEAEDDLRKILLDNINWNVEIEFAVSYLFSFIECKISCSGFEKVRRTLGSSFQGNLAFWRKMLTF